MIVGKKEVDKIAKRAVPCRHHVASSICGDTSSEGGTLFISTARNQPLPHGILHLLLHLPDTRCGSRTLRVSPNLSVRDTGRIADQFLETGNRNRRCFDLVRRYIHHVRRVTFL